MRRSVLALIGVLAAGTVLAASCSSSEEASSGPSEQADGPEVVTDYTVPATGEPHRGGGLVYALEAETDGLSPVDNRFAVSGLLIGNAVFDPLAAWGADGKIYPYLAESFEPSDLFTEWTVRLRPDVRFHDGTPANAEALQQFLLALRDSPLTGAAARPIEDVTLVEGDDLSVVVHLSEPWVVFPAVLAGQGGMLMAPSQLDAGPEGARRPVGTGPFSFVNWEPDARLDLVRNDDYWQEGLPYLEEVQFQPIPDLQNRVAALETGSVDVMHVGQQQQRAKLTDLAEAGDIQLWFASGEDDEALILLNNAAEPFSDQRLRVALAHATELDEYFQTTGTPDSRRADSFLSAESTWYEPDNGWPTYDLAEAQRLVDEWKAEHDGETPSFVLRTTPAPEQQTTAQLLKRQWEEAGFSVELETMEQTQFIAQALAGNYQAHLWRQYSSPDPDGEFHWWASRAISEGDQIGLNLPRLDDEEVDQALIDGRSNLDPAARKEAYARLQRRISELVPFVFLSHLQWMIAADLDVRDLLNTTLPDGTESMPVVAGVHRLTQTWIEN